MTVAVQEKARRFAEKYDAMDPAVTAIAESEDWPDWKRVYKRKRIRDCGLLLSLGGVLVCNQFGLGLGTAICQGLLTVALGNPHRHFV